MANNSSLSKRAALRQQQEMDERNKRNKRIKRKQSAHRAHAAAQRPPQNPACRLTDRR